MTSLLASYGQPDINLAGRGSSEGGRGFQLLLNSPQWGATRLSLFDKLIYTTANISFPFSQQISPFREISDEFHECYDMIHKYYPPHP
jgi:hypothetical protein